MRDFIEFSAVFTLILVGLVMLGGEYALIFGGVALVGMLFAAIYTTHRKTKEDLERIEKKLDQLLERKAEQEN